MKSTSEIYKRLVTNASSVSSKTFNRRFYSTMAAVSYRFWNGAQSHSTKAGRTRPSYLRALAEQTSLHGIQNLLQPNMGSIRYSLWLLAIWDHWASSYTTILQLYYFLFPIPPCHPTRWEEQPDSLSPLLHCATWTRSGCRLSRTVMCSTWRDLGPSCRHRPQ